MGSGPCSATRRVTCGAKAPSHGQRSHFCVLPLAGGNHPPHPSTIYPDTAKHHSLQVTNLPAYSILSNRSEIANQWPICLTEPSDLLCYALQCCLFTVLLKEKGIVHSAGTHLCFAAPRTQARKAVGIVILSVTQDKPTTDA